MTDRHQTARSGTLYVVATPIGNLKDITLRAIETLTTVDLIAAEDTRHTKRLLHAHAIQGKLISYHEHNERQRTAELIQRLEDGLSIALVTDAGTPTVSDPGYPLIAAAIDRGILVVPVPGASSAVTAMSVSGLPSSAFTFIGFPARKKKKRLEQLRLLRQHPHTLIFYQSPRRLLAFLEELAAVMGNRAAVLAREQTKMHEEYLRAPLLEMVDTLQKRPSIKGECTLLVSGAIAPEPTDAAIEAAIDQALADPSRSTGDIAKMVAKQFGVSRKQIYEKTLKKKTR